MQPVFLFIFTFTIFTELCYSLDLFSSSGLTQLHQ